MNAVKRIFSYAGMTLILAMASSAFASTTKVGNGDEGSDLEGAVPITGGIIYESRAAALENLRKLNVQGIAGLGLVIAELEHSPMLLATADVRPISLDGGWESSEDRKTVYARTFAEPHAPTRFFPAALKLTRAQLIALHTHEALHRALPAHAREDEDKVAILTMAITSPAASFDRVNLIANSILPRGEASPAPAYAANSTVAAVEPEPELPPASRAQIKLSNTASSLAYPANVGRIGGEFSPVGVTTIRKRVAEPRLKIEQILLYDDQGYYAGPLTFTGKLAILHESSTKKMGPLAQINLKSLQQEGVSGPYDRDVYTIGAFYDHSALRRYHDYMFTYTLPGESRHRDPWAGEITAASKYQIGSIWSAYAREGFQWKWFSMGGAFEFHHSKDGHSGDPFSILRAGPEIQFKAHRVRMGLAVMFLLLNNDYASLNSLGDLAGHGTGRDSFSGSIAIEL